MGLATYGRGRGRGPRSALHAKVHDRAIAADVGNEPPARCARERGDHAGEPCPVSSRSHDERRGRPSQLDLVGSPHAPDHVHESRDLHGTEYSAPAAPRRKAHSLRIQQHRARELHVVAREERPTVDPRRAHEHARTRRVRVEQTLDVVDHHPELGRGGLVRRPLVTGNRRPPLSPGTKHGIAQFRRVLGTLRRPELALIEQRLRDPRQSRHVAHASLLTAEGFHHLVARPPFEPPHEPAEPVEEPHDAPVQVGQVLKTDGAALDTEERRDVGAGQHGDSAR